MLRIFAPDAPARTAGTGELLSQVTAIVKTFQRPDCLKRLILSLRRFYPELRVLVGDDGIVPSACEGAEYVRLPPDIGLSAGRNALLARVQTPYVLLLDDDVEFTRRTKIEQLVQLVASGHLDLAAGNCKKIKRMWIFLRQRPQPFHGLFDFRGSELRLSRGNLGSGAGYQLCDIAHNFYAARVDAIRSMGAWDAELRQNEHVEFFVRARRHGLRVGYCENVVIRHWIDRPPGYAAFRNRSFHHVAAKKIGVERIVGFRGEVFGAVGSNTPVIEQPFPAMVRQAA